MNMDRSLRYIPYLQDWIMDEDAPLTWHLRADRAGAGVLYDLGSHAVDLARYLVGEPVAVTARLETFIKERPLPGAGAATFSKGEKVEGTPMANMYTVKSSFGELANKEANMAAQCRT